MVSRETYVAVKLAEIKLLEHIDAHIHERADYWRDKEVIEDASYWFQDILNETGEMWQDLHESLIENGYKMEVDPETGEVLAVTCLQGGD